MRMQQLRLFAFVILCLLIPGFFSISGFAQDISATDAEAISRLAGAVQRADSVAALRPNAIVDRIGRKPFALFDFVRDKISFQVYRGVLRGAEGTLAAKAGNAWDQAVLLKTMFDYAGVNSSILRVGLSEEQARQLVESMKASPAPDLQVFGPADLSNLGVDTERYASASKERDAAVSQFITKVKERSDTDAAAIEKAGTIRVGTPDLITATRDYVWVQAEIGGKPYDFHPAFPDGKQPVLLPAGVMQYVTSIPTNLFHWVRVRLFIERLTDTGLDRSIILDKQVLPAVSAGLASRVALRPSRIDERFLRLNPALTIGDQVLSGTGATVTAYEGKALPGSATAIWLEVTLMSPGEPPRVVTLTLADAFGEDRERLYDESAQIEPVPFTEDAFNLSAELHYVTSEVPPERWAEMLAVSMSRLADAGRRNITVKSGGLFGLMPDNPLLSAWSALQANVTPGTYLDAPAVAAMVYSPEGNGIQTRGKVLFSRFMNAETRKRDPDSSIASARLLEAVAEKLGGAVHSAGAYAEYEDGDFTDWDVLSRQELKDARERNLQLWLPVGKNDHWWSSEAAGGIVLNGPGGWSVALPGTQDAATTEMMLAGELARLVPGLPSDTLTPENTMKGLNVLMSNYATISISPLAPALNSIK